MAIKMEHIVEHYYKELENGKILGRKCPACGVIQFPPRTACTACGNFEQEWVEISRKAKVTDITLPSRMTGADTVKAFDPFVMGIFHLEDGPEINGILKDVIDGKALKEKLPLDVTATIYQLENSKTVVFELDK